MELYTHNDLDGISCGILAKLAYGKKVNVSYLSIGAFHHKLSKVFETKEAANIFVTDLSVQGEEIDHINQLIDEGGSFTLIDHHQSAFELNEYDWATVTVESSNGIKECATSLYYRYLINEGTLKESTILNEYVEHVRQYDVWDWEKDNNVIAKQLNDLLTLMSFEEYESRIRSKIESDEEFTFDQFESSLLSIEEERMNRYISRKKRSVFQVEFQNHLVGIVYADSYISELGNTLGKLYSHLDYIAILNLGNKRLSLRTIHDHIDVSKVASTLHGGGHQKASGATLTEEAFEAMVIAAYKAEPLHMDATDNQFNVKENKDGVLYVNSEGTRIWVYYRDGSWYINENLHHTLDHDFSSFGEAERYIKKTYLAGLAKDRSFVSYLLEKLHQA
ncbi:hypothetical protein Q73_06995 [Bacillus coahuilensis m2-6]|uniref:DHH family phosphoesterase n=1 Tax=Bacillus coahuilensis TaxID=408580 RepID=UPI0007503A8D|nr:hypothetical protein [Bacillus coahuilensis]KUP08255.1 hypothetical protein Q73_06995 [Bacillus coahuilensis m2-6]